MAAELAGITRIFLASIHREASTEPAFYTLIHHTVGVTLLMVDSNWILGLHYILYRDKTFIKLDHNFLLLKEYQCTVRGEWLHEKACFFNAKQRKDQLHIVHTAYQQFGFSLPGYSTF